MSAPKTRSVAMLAGLIMAACGGGVGPAGPAGPAGAPGSSGTNGSSGASGSNGSAGSATSAPKTPGWYDATGAFVSNVVYFGPTVMDSRGFFWILDAETATVFLVARPQLFTATGCAGQAYTYAIPPRLPFMITNESTYRVRPDNLVSQSITSASTLTPAGVCLNGGGVYPNVIPIDSRSAPSPEALPPSVGFSPPLHLEVK